MQEIAEVVSKVRIDACNQRIARKIAVLPQVDFAEQEIANGIGAKLINKSDRIDDIAFGLAHLVAIDDEPAVTVDLFRQRKVECH